LGQRRIAGLDLVAPALEIGLEVVLAIAPVASPRSLI
jgi:hypothetical protein